MPLNGRSFQGLILLTPGVVTQTPQQKAKCASNEDYISFPHQGRRPSDFHVVWATLSWPEQEFWFRSLLATFSTRASVCIVRPWLDRNLRNLAARSGTNPHSCLETPSAPPGS